MARFSRALATMIALMSLAGVSHAAEGRWTSVTIAIEGAFHPWNFMKADGALDGFEVDLARDLCVRMKVECSFVIQSFDGIIPALTSKKFDAIMSGMQITAKREETIAFSQPYGNTGQTFATTKSGQVVLPDSGHVLSLATDEAGVIAKIETIKPLLQGKTVGVQSASTGEAFVDKHFQGVVTVKQYQTSEMHDLDLKSGRIDLVFTSVGYLRTVAGKPGNEDIVLTGPYFQGGMLGRGVGVDLRKSDTNLKAMFDTALAAAKSDGTLKRLSQKWFAFDISPR